MISELGFVTGRLACVLVVIIHAFPVAFVCIELLLYPHTEVASHLSFRVGLLQDLLPG